jgi:hypothetical protein
MKVSVLGAGRIGSVLAKLLVGTGNQVVLANARGPLSLAPLVEGLGRSASALDTPAAVAAAEVVVLMVPFGQVKDLFPAELAEGKIVVDATNSFPALAGGPSAATSSELVAAWYPGTRVVKSLNTMNFATLAQAGGGAHDEQLAHYVAGDDQPAKDVVARLVASLGFAVVDTGSLHEGSLRQQPGGPLFNVQMTEAQALRTLQQVGVAS